MISVKCFSPMPITAFIKAIMPYKPPAITRTGQRNVMYILFFFFLFLDVSGHNKHVIDAVLKFLIR
jgi:hypothetical protein